MTDNVKWADNATTYTETEAKSQADRLLMCTESLFVVIDALACCCSILFTKGIAVQLMRDKIDDLLDIRAPLAVLKRELEEIKDEK